MSRASPGCSKTRQLLFYTHRSARQARTVPTAQHTSTYYNSPRSRGATRTRCGLLRPPGNAAKIANHNSFSNSCTDFAHERRSSAGDAASFAVSMMLVACDVQHTRCLRRCSARPTKRSSPWCVARQRNRCVGDVGRNTPRCQTGTQPWPLPCAQRLFCQRHLQSVEARSRCRIFSVAP
jgi:hypothetical protein